MNNLNLLSLFKRFSDNKFIIFFDQAFFAFFNFGSIFLLSKLASVPVFSSFVIFHSYIFFIFIFSTLFLSAPILVLLAKKWKKKEESYLSTLLFANFLINCSLASVCFIFMKQQGIQIHFIFVLLVPFLMSMFDIIKKFLFSSFRIHFRHAAISSILLNLTFFLAVFILKDTLTLRTILILYAGAYLLANLYLFVVLFLYKILHKNALKLSNYRWHQTLKIIQHHYTYSKWIILGGIAFWGYSQGGYILAKSYGISDFTIGKVRTIQNLLGVFNILLISIENHYTPIFAAKANQTNFQELTRMVYKVIKGNYIKIVALFIVAIPVGLLFYEMIYGEKYGNGVIIFFIFLLVQLLLIGIRPFTIALKSIENTIPFFVSHLVAVLSLIIMIPLFIYLKNSYTLPFAILLANVVYVAYIGTHYYLKKKKTIV